MNYTDTIFQKNFEKKAERVLDDCELYNEAIRHFSSVNYSFSIEEDGNEPIFGAIGNFGIPKDMLKEAEEKNQPIFLNISWIMGQLPKKLKRFVNKFEKDDNLYLALQYEDENGERVPYFTFDNIKMSESEGKSLMKFQLSSELIERLKKEEYVLLELTNLYLLQVNENNFVKITFPITAIPIYLIDFEEHLDEESDSFEYH